MKEFRSGPEISFREHKEEIATTTFEDALHEQSGDGLLYKIDDREIADAIERRGLEIDEATKEKLLNFPKNDRLLGHLFRLLSPGRSQAERGLAMVMLDEYEKALDRFTHLLDDEESLQSAFETQKHIQDVDDFAMAVGSVGTVPGGDCVDTKMWWTFAPYLDKAMQEQGATPEERMDRLVAWCINPALLSYDDANRVHLPGLEFMNDDREQRAETYTLSSNLEGPTHTFTKEMAKKLIQEHAL